MSQFYIDNKARKLSDKFDMSKFMEFTDNFDPLTSKFMGSLSTLKAVTSYMVQGEENRPDLISRKLFDDTQYWWIMLLYNKVTKIENISAGDGLKIPSLGSVEDLMFSLKSQV